VNAVGQKQGEEGRSRELAGDVRELAGNDERLRELTGEVTMVVGNSDVVAAAVALRKQV
jgi:hypothetical protein